MYKLQVQEDNGVWHDVKSAEGKLLTFSKEPDARAKLEELFPLLVKMEKFAAGPKRTRVLVMLRELEDEEEAKKNR
ncbi:MAG: hypothetical protein WCD07_10395 [Burkholderiales bacterium]